MYRTNFSFLLTASVFIAIIIPAEGELEFNRPWTKNNPVITVPFDEEQPANTLVTTLIAYNPTTNARVEDFTEIPGTDPDDIFTLNTRTGQLYINQEFDYDTITKRQYTVQVRAQAEGQTVTATVVVNIVDINDNSPRFQQNSYSFSIQENSRSPATVGTVQATDLDSGDYGEVEYSLQGVENVFVIDPDTGVISVAPNANLDRDVISSYSLLVTATDKAQDTAVRKATSVHLTVTLLDQNDNPPKFEQQQYTFYTLDTAKAQSQIGQVQAMDPDVGTNGQIQYSIQSGNNQGLFSLNTQSGIITTTRVLTGSSRSAPYVLTVQARDGGPNPYTTKVTVNIFVSSVQFNDGRPRFIFPAVEGEEVRVQEEIPNGSNITQVIAADSDTGEAGRITFKFLDNQQFRRDHDKFFIDPRTGVIISRARLDRETQISYLLYIVIQDNGQPVQEASRSLRVVLTDIDDQMASFRNCPGIPVNDPKIIDVQEKMAPGLMVTTIQGCDTDDPPNNKVFYFITCGNQVQPTLGALAPFAINRNTGVLRTQVEMDRDKINRFQLCIKITNDENFDPVSNPSTFDSSANDPSIQRLVINIQDKDSMGPNFSPLTRQIGTGQIVAGIKSNIEKGDVVLTLIITGQDPDIDYDNVYRLSNIQFINNNNEIKDTPDAFRVGRTDGIVRTNVDSYEDFTNGHFQMNATGSDNTFRVASSRLFIYVMDEGDVLKFVFDKPKTEVSDFVDEFLGEVNSIIRDMQAIQLKVYSHINNDKMIDNSKADLCFYAIENNKVSSKEDVIDRLSSREVQLQPTYSTYSVSGIGECKTDVSTVTYMGNDWYWWFLVALAILLFILVLICIIVICCCYARYRKQVYKSKPYIIVDPVSANGSIKDLEWQETTVRM